MNFKESTKAWLVEQYGEPESLEQLFELHKAVLQKQLDRSNALLGLAWSISYREKISNTHCAPIKGETNWGCKPGKASGYPGFTGRVWVRYKEVIKRGWACDMFNKALTYPGTGGFGSYDGPWKHIVSERYRIHGRDVGDDLFPEVVCYSWDFRFFADDYPLIVPNWTKDKMFDIIKTNIVPNISDYREWNDPEQEQLDKAFISYHEFAKQVRFEL